MQEKFNGWWMAQHRWCMPDRWKLSLMDTWEYSPGVDPGILKKKGGGGGAIAKVLVAPSTRRRFLFKNLNRNKGVGVGLSPMRPVIPRMLSNEKESG